MAGQVSQQQKPEPDDNFRTYNTNDRPSRFIVSLNFEKKKKKTKISSDSYILL